MHREDGVVAQVQEVDHVLLLLLVVDVYNAEVLLLQEGLEVHILYRHPIMPKFTVVVLEPLVEPDLALERLSIWVWHCGKVDLHNLLIGDDVEVAVEVHAVLIEIVNVHNQAEAVCA